MSKKRSKKNKLDQPIASTETVSISWITTEMKGFIFLTFALVLFLSLLSFSYTPDTTNLLGQIGHAIGWVFHSIFGIVSYVWPAVIAWIGWRLFFNKSLNYLGLKIVYVLIASFSLALLISVIEKEFTELSTNIGSFFYPGLWFSSLRPHLGGAPFYYLYSDLPHLNLKFLLNSFGVSLIFTCSLITSLLFLFKLDISSLFNKMAAEIKRCFINRRQKNGQDESELTLSKDSDFLRYVKLRIPSSNLGADPECNLQNLETIEIEPQKNLTVRPSISSKNSFIADVDTDLLEKSDNYALEPEDEFISPKVSDKSPTKKKASLSLRDEAIKSQKIYNGDFTNFAIPDAGLLKSAQKVDQSSLRKDLKRQAEVLEETLQSFGIEAKVGQINCGPTITSFEVHPAIGVKVQKIKTLDNDIALNMEAKSIRIIAPIPGKAAVGIEVPNAKPQEVGFKDLLNAYKQRKDKFHIPILLGKAVNGDYVMSDLAKMPHCIIAGATGSGKSVCINTIIMSILLNAKPDEIKLIMVDPKKVELTPYSKLPHMLAPVITEPGGAAAALSWLVKEMERRYELLKLIGVRNIASFNTRKVDVEKEESLKVEVPKALPYIVAIIDELADLMMVASGDIETPIARIAQMARAVGIHLILATQRPSREVITGIIKANFPTRISFKVASRVNSQIVLDETGAETLLGNGDMLFLPPGSSHLIRAQGAFISDDDILKVIDHICKQAPPNYVIESFDQFNGPDLDDTQSGLENLDSLYDQAKEIVISTGNASTTFLQRKLKIGYARAASLMDQLESMGVVGPSEGAKSRKVYAKSSGDDAEDGETL